MHSSSTVYFLILVTILLFNFIIDDRIIKRYRKKFKHRHFEIFFETVSSVTKKGNFADASVADEFY